MWSGEASQTVKGQTVTLKSMHPFNVIYKLLVVLAVMGEGGGGWNVSQHAVGQRQGTPWKHRERAGRQRNINTH